MPSSLSVFCIQGKQKPSSLSISRGMDFSCVESGSIEPEALVLDNAYSLYSFDPRKQQAVLVATEGDLFAPPFFYDAQYRAATKAVFVPLDDFLALCQPLPLPSACFVFSLPRSGSTFFSRLLSRAFGLQLLSEPDALSALWAMKEMGISQDRAKMIARAALSFLCRGKEKAMWVVKPRSFCQTLAPIFGEMGMKNLFLYRDVFSWARSYLRAFSRGDEENPWQRHFLDQVRAFLQELLPPGTSPPSLDTPERLAVASWMKAMEEFLRAQDHFLSALRYEDLCVSPFGCLQALSPVLGLEITASEKDLEPLFAQDTQAGTVLSRDQVAQVAVDEKAITLAMESLLPLWRKKGAPLERNETNITIPRTIGIKKGP